MKDAARFRRVSIDRLVRRNPQILNRVPGWLPSEGWPGAGGGRYACDGPVGYGGGQIRRRVDTSQIRKKLFVRPGLRAQTLTRTKDQQAVVGAFSLAFSTGFHCRAGPGIAAARKNFRLVNEIFNKDGNFVRAPATKDIFTRSSSNDTRTRAAAEGSFLCINKYNT